jgi:hypothetical protein
MGAMTSLPRNMTARAAVFSPCRRYRYWLRRDLTDRRDRYVLWIMMNPSRATGDFNDATTTMTTGISARHGYDVHGVVNLSPVIEPNSANLSAEAGNVDEANMLAVKRALSWISRHKGDIVIAWGANRHLKQRGEELLHRLRRRPLLCLGRNADGSPRFPKYIPATSRLITFDR